MSQVQAALAGDLQVEALHDPSAEVHKRYPRNKEQWSDQLWRLHNLYYIVDKQGNRVLFRPNWAQLELYENLWYLDVILKARQLGCTTFIDLLLLDSCVWYPNKRAGIIAHTLTDAKTIFREKVKYPFDNLPDAIREEVAPRQDSVNELLFANNSSLRVGTSMRSATLNYLHISEYGKVCAQNPEKAREIKTGALNTVQAGQLVLIESTAEGRDGHFYELCQRAQKDEQLGVELSPLDYRLFFFPWWRHPDYQLEIEPGDDPIIPTEWLEYFDELEGKIGRRLTLGQKLWYVKKALDQGEDMKREYPSTPEEAFFASIEGAYYAKQMAQVRFEKRIRRVPYVPSVPVNTFWDLGFNDNTFIVCHQHIGLEHRFINCYENSGESLAHYVNWLQAQGYVLGQHFLPHDAEQHKLQTGKTDYDVLWDLGLRSMTVVPRVEQDRLGVEAVRQVLPQCWFDAERCKRLIDCLDSFRKEWDEKRGTWKETPLHDWASHGAKAFEQYARGYQRSATSSSRSRKRRSRNAMVV